MGYAFTCYSNVIFCLFVVVAILSTMVDFFGKRKDHILVFIFTSFRFWCQSTTEDFLVIFPGKLLVLFISLIIARKQAAAVLYCNTVVAACALGLSLQHCSHSSEQLCADCLPDCVGDKKSLFGSSKKHKESVQFSLWPIGSSFEGSNCLSFVGRFSRSHAEVSLYKNLSL